MRIINNTNYPLYIDDINVLVPVKKNGVCDISDSVALKSNQIVNLLKSNKISLAYVSKEDVRYIEDKGHKMYIIHGDTVWSGKGKTVPVFSNRASHGMSVEEFIKNKTSYLKSIPKKYVIARNCNESISLEKISVVLTKQFSTTTISESYYNSIDIQNFIKSGKIVLVKVLEAKVDNNGLCKFGDAPILPVDLKTDIVNIKQNPNYNNTHCIWEGPITDSGGYANMNRQYVFNLSQLGLKVKPSIVFSDRQLEKNIREKIDFLSKTKVKLNCPKIYATNAPSPYSGKIISYTMMETENVIHRNLVNKLNISNEIWVPSEWNKTVFYNSGIKKEIKVMPLGIDKSMYCPREPSVFFSFPTKRYVFYSVSTWIWRKGWDVLLKAYSKAFTNDDDVSLVIFSHVPALPIDKYSIHIQQYINTLFAGVDTSRFPNLSIITSVLPSSIVPFIYNSVDCFVLFSRGEGWGLPYCEAIASGLPIIGADHGGQQMFLNNNNSLLVKPDVISACHPTLLYMTPFYQGMKFADYSNKAIDEASEKMRYAYENPCIMKEKAFLCRENLLKNFLWEQSSIRVAERLKSLQ